MKARSKKYYTRIKDDGSKKGSATNAGYDEQNELTSMEPKENPAPSVLEDKVQSEASKESNK